MLLLLSDGESDLVTRIGSFELFILNNHDSEIILRPDTITPSRGIFKCHIKVIIYRGTNSYLLQCMYGCSIQFHVSQFNLLQP